MSYVSQRYVDGLEQRVRELEAELKAKEAENERLREALQNIHEHHTIRSEFYIDDGECAASMADIAAQALEGEK